TKENTKAMVDSGLDDLNISLDGASQETYSKYRKQGNFQTTIDNIKNLVEEKKKSGKKYPKITLQFIVMKHNEHEIDKIKQIAKELGVDSLQIKSVKVDTVEEAKQYLPSKENLRRYNIEGEHLVQAGAKSKMTCKMLWTEATIWADGSVVPCCYDYSSKHVFGNAFKTGFKEIWKGEKMNNFRKQFLKDMNQIPICKNCPRNTSDSSGLIEDEKVRQ
ncbi:MAG: radical SAM/SPASM domain-containing protein, partial [Candidatus Aenigmarchaeota archaeon]|nr:radical SAM/SPASM domain-containing protein [Candidatus Aenigmarchaeota archaeon]